MSLLRHVLLFACIATTAALRVPPASGLVRARLQRPLAARLPRMEEKSGGFPNPFAQTKEAPKSADGEDEDGWTLDKVAKLGLAGVLSIAVAESVFWILSFPVSAIVYYVATGEWINLFEQEGQIKFLAFTAGWGALGGAIAQYRTVLTAAAITPWMDRTVVQPYLTPMMEKFKSDD